MFCALVVILVLMLVLIFGVTISAIDIADYNFGLYYALLAIVGMMISCAICVLKPPNCNRNPKWYDRCCLELEVYLATLPVPTNAHRSREPSANLGMLLVVGATFIRNQLIGKLGSDHMGH